VAATLGERLDVVDFLGGREPSGFLALFAQRIRFHVLPQRF
jgi:hypothetical protein